MQGEELAKNRCRGRLKFRLGPRFSSIVYDALGPEKGRSVPRTDAKFGVEDGILSMELECEDSGVLRAALNTYVRWIEVAREAAEICEIREEDDRKERYNSNE